MQNQEHSKIYIGSPKHPIKITVSKKALENEPYLKWNSFIEIISSNEFHDLTPKQRIAQLAFWYDSEVQNGGHLYYFENIGIEYLDETIEALNILDAKCQQNILSKASAIHNTKTRSKITSQEDMIKRALEGEYSEYDEEYYECKPDINYYLKMYLEENINEFINFVE
jgi:hypothetical protein